MRLKGERLVAQQSQTLADMRAEANRFHEERVKKQGARWVKRNRKMELELKKSYSTVMIGKDFSLGSLFYLLPVLFEYLVIIILASCEEGRVLSRFSCPVISGYSRRGCLLDGFVGHFTHARSTCLLPFLLPQDK